MPSEYQRKLPHIRPPKTPTQEWVLSSPKGWLPKGGRFKKITIPTSASDLFRQPSLFDALAGEPEFVQPRIPSPSEARQLGSMPRGNFEKVVEGSSPYTKATNIAEEAVTAAPKTGFFSKLGNIGSKIANSKGVSKVKGLVKIAAPVTTAMMIRDMSEDIFPGSGKYIDQPYLELAKFGVRNIHNLANRKPTTEVTVSPGSQAQINKFDDPQKSREKLEFGAPITGRLKENMGDVNLPNELPDLERFGDGGEFARLGELESAGRNMSGASGAEGLRLAELESAGARATENARKKPLSFTTGQKKKNPMTFKPPFIPVYDGIRDDDVTKLPPLESFDIPDQLPLASRDMSGPKYNGYANTNADEIFEDNQQSGETESKLTAFDRYMDLVTHMPDRKDYSPSIWRRIAAGIAGAGAGITGRDGFNTARQITEQPYQSALSDWSGQLEELKPIAQIENQREMNEARLKEQARKTDLINQTKTVENEIKRLQVEGKIVNDAERNAITREMGEIRQLIANGQLEVAKSRIEVIREHYKMSDETNRMRANTQATSIANQNVNRDARTQIARDSANKPKGSAGNPLPKIREARKLAAQDMDQLYPGMDMNTKQAEWEKILSDPKNPKRAEVLAKYQEFEDKYLKLGGVVK
jgi:hypothetical protein